MTKEEILAGESEVLEFKRDVPEQSIKFIKTVVAFANGKGGTIVFGVDDKTHKIVGIKKSEVFQKADIIADTIFNSCEPKIRPIINLQEIDKRYIIVVTVPSGMQQPYYIKSRGLPRALLFAWRQRPAKPNDICLRNWFLKVKTNRSISNRLAKSSQRRKLKIFVTRFMILRQQH